MRPFQLTTLLLTFTFLLSCQKHEVIHEYKIIEPDFDRSTTEYFVQSTDDAVKAANLLILRELPLDDEWSEIRIWVGFNAMILQGFYSIDPNQGVSGKKVWYFEPPGNQWDEGEYDEFVDELYQSCDRIGTYNETEACVDTEYIFDWRAIYHELLELDI